jgi:rhodanese-related sulfurtransferase
MFGFSKIKSVSTDELVSRLQQNKTQLIDVREPHEYAAGHIKGARNVPGGNIESLTVPAGTKLFVICHSGMRSKRAYKILDKKGFDVTNVNGGMMSWKGLTVKK